MLTVAQYSNLINEHIAHISYPSEPNGLYEPIRYSLDAGGKRIRPVLTLATCEAFGADPLHAINQALGIEMFHNFTLLHDDLMDHSPVRRSRPTVYVKWDERTAILSGDAMLTMAGMLMRGGEASSLPAPALTQLLDLYDRTAMEVYEGQQLDMDFEARNDVAVEEYMNMIRLKTSVLLGCACQLGAIMAGACDPDAKAMYRYGELLGLAFQMQDDYLDTFGDTETFGKPIGGDILNEKKTWLLISAMHRVHDHSLADALILDNPADKIEAVRDIYRVLGLDRECRQMVTRFSSEAIASLPESLSQEAMEFFMSLARNAETRTK